MRMWITLSCIVLLFGAVWIGSAGQPVQPDKKPKADPVPPPQACVHEPHDKLCSYLPHDVVTKLMPGYSQLAAAQQRPFDNFSWQSFVALNWPADKDGKPLPDSITTHPEAPRVWEFYKTPFEVFDSGRIHPLGQNEPAKGRRIFRMMSTRSNLDELAKLPVDSFLEATGQPLIDRNLNFVLYDIVLNEVESEYIKNNGLQTKAGQQKFKDMGKKVSFPLGFYKDPMKLTGGSVGAIEIKTSWRMLDPKKDDLKKYYTVDGDIYIDAKYTVAGKALHIHSKMGLVGMHIIQRTTGPYTTKGGTFPQDWIWSTFEHVENAPLAGNARDATNINLPLPASGTSPAGVMQTFSFFNPKYMGPTNVAPKTKPGDKYYLWKDKAPYAAGYANDGKYGTQVVRDWKIFPPTVEVTKYFHNLLKGSVWTNYELVGSQWMGGVEDPMVQNGHIPRYLSNTTLETYIQFNSSQQKPPVNPEGSCLFCHQRATAAVPGLSANFSFLLGRAH